MHAGERLMKNSQKSFTDKKFIKYTLLLAVLLLVTAFAGVCLGSAGISPAALIRVLFGAERGTTEANIILLARLPRVCGCIVAGTALAVSGAVIQTVLSNPLAAPNVIGVNAGAGLAVALFSAVFPNMIFAVPVAAFAGALIAVLLVLLIAERSGAARITLVLAGVAVSSIFSALIDAVITFFPDSLNGYSDFRIGGLANVTMAKIGPAAVIVLIAVIILLTMHNEMDVLSLGIDTAKSLGMNAAPVRIILLTIAAALAGAAVSFAGLLGFVGLIVPHIMRRLFGETSRELIITSALGGAVLLLVCDLASRLLFAPYELPVGILLSCVGGPFFINLLLKQRGGRNRD